MKAVSCGVLVFDPSGSLLLGHANESRVLVEAATGTSRKARAPRRRRGRRPPCAKPSKNAGFNCGANNCERDRSFRVPAGQGASALRRAGDALRSQKLCVLQLLHGPPWAAVPRDEWISLGQTRRVAATVCAQPGRGADASGLAGRDPRAAVVRGGTARCSASAAQCSRD